MLSDFDDFTKALNGARGEFDAWLEVHNEKECIAYIKEAIEQAAIAEQAAPAGEAVATVMVGSADFGPFNFTPTNYGYDHLADGEHKLYTTPQSAECKRFAELESIAYLRSDEANKVMGMFKELQAKAAQLSNEPAVCERCDLNEAIGAGNTNLIEVLEAKVAELDAAYKDKTRRHADNAAVLLGEIARAKAVIEKSEGVVAELIGVSPLNGQANHRGNEYLAAIADYLKVPE